MDQHANSEQPVSVQQTEIIATTELDLKSLDLYQVKYAGRSSSRKDYSSSLKTNRKAQLFLWRKARHTCVNNLWYLALQGVKSLPQHVCPAGRKEQACPWTCLILQTAQELDWSQQLSAGKPAPETNDAGICLPLRQTELEKQKYVGQGEKQ